MGYKGGQGELNTYFDTELNLWVVSCDIQLSDGTFYGEILGTAPSAAAAARLVKTLEAAEIKCPPVEITK